MERTWNRTMNEIATTCNNEYAKAYADAGFGMIGEEKRVQALYILNNIAHWRTGNAKEIREYLKKVSKGG